LSPVLCLLGDIGLPLCSDAFHRNAYRAYIHHQAERFEHVLLVTGNHEYWTGGVATMTEVEAAVRDVAASAPRKNVHFLQRDIVELSGIRFAGCTLWCAIPTPGVGSVLGRSVNDFKQIAMHSAPAIHHKSESAVRLLEPDDVAAAHSHDVEFIRRVIAESAASAPVALAAGGSASETPPRVLPLVILTHYAPTFRMTAIPSEFEAWPSELRWMHGDDLEGLMGPPVRVWAYGHTHRSVSQVIRGTLVVSNQAGYCIHDAAVKSGMPETDPFFDADRVIRVSFDEAEVSAARIGWRGQSPEKPPSGVHSWTPGLS
jgi:hypothetical protein